MAVAKVNVTTLDNNSETTQFGVSASQPLAGDYSDLKTSVATLVGLIELVSFLNKKSSTITIPEKYPVVKPTDPSANREAGVRFQMQDSAANKASVTLGGPDYSQFPFVVADSDIVTIPRAGLNANVQLLIDWLNAWAVHPVTGNQLTVYAIEKVGRNI